MTNLISVDRLNKRLQNNRNNTLIVDVRFDLMDEDAGRRKYLESHIPTAAYLDLNKDLSGKREKHGGNHPLPDFRVLAGKMGGIGMDSDTTVVIYDDGADMFAPRLWWLLETMGHRKAYILEGGFHRWVAEGNEVTDEIPTFEEKEFTSVIQKNRIADMKEVKEKLEKGEARLIDSRSHARYLGDEEPLYRKAGHIPGAENYFWKDVVADDGTWLKGEKLAEHFSALDKEEEIIVSCGSGVSACANIIAMEAAGFENIKLYPGSFSDWISYDENPVVKGKE